MKGEDIHELFSEAIRMQLMGARSPYLKILLCLSPSPDLSFVA